MIRTSVMRELYTAITDITAKVNLLIFTIAIITFQPIPMDRLKFYDLNDQSTSK